jgi:hypothetical protein
MIVTVGMIVTAMRMIMFTLGMIVIMGMRLLHWLRSYCIAAGYGASGRFFLLRVRGPVL